MASYNFDIIIILIVLLSIIKGYNRGQFYQLASTLSISIPVLVLQFLGNKIFEIVESNSLFITISNFIYNIFKSVSNVDLLYIQRIFLYAIVFLVIYLVIKSIFRIIRPGREKNLLGYKTNISKVIGSALGLVAAYFIIVIVFIFIKPITNINEDKPLTNLTIKSITLLKDDFELIVPLEEVDEEA